jgi:hypothetical protein
VENRSSEGSQHSLVKAATTRVAVWRTTPDFVIAALPPSLLTVAGALEP